MRLTFGICCCFVTNTIHTPTNSHSSIHLINSIMTSIYPDHYKDDTDLIHCLSILVLPANSLDDDNLATNAVIQVLQPEGTFAVVVDSDDSDEENQRYCYPQDSVYWTKYINSPQRQMDRLIAALDLQDLECYFSCMYPLLCPHSGS